jgi:pimeloyl-ACP methyl ester carboxylesterase
LKFERFSGLSSAIPLVAGAVGALAGAAALVARSTRSAERANPPTGSFIRVRGIKLHYTDSGSGNPVVLLHGNGVTAMDWNVSGVLDGLNPGYRVIAFDRPGFGYSERPRDRSWTPAAQAELLHEALEQIGVSRPVIVGHSWGTLVALAMALDRPSKVYSLVLLSGYYFPSLRIDAMLQLPPASPVVGDLLRHTISPLLGRLMSPSVVRKLFAPAPVPQRFQRFPLALSLRPSQLRASAEEAVLMVPSAAALEHRYGELTMPVAIIAGAGDRIVDPHAQSNRLAHVVLKRDAQLVAGAGHMVHYFAPESVVAAVALQSGVTDTDIAARFTARERATVS